MNNDAISKETYDRLANVLGKPDEYLEGKVCSYQMLSQIDGCFFFNLDKDYLKDYFLIKDWVKFSFYNAGLLEKLFEKDSYKQISLENIQLIWNAFNENKKESSDKDHKFYHDKRFHYIPKIATLLITNSRRYEPEKVFPLLKELMTNMKEENKDYSLARKCAKLMGDYLTHNKDINNDIFEYLKEQQNIQILNLYLIFYDFQIPRIGKKEKIKMIIDLIQEKKPEVTMKEMIKEALERNTFHIIKYINANFNYKFDEDELEKIFKQQKSSFWDENTQYIIENFQPARLVGRAFSKVYSEYKYSSKIKETEFYNNTIEYLKRKVSYDELNEKIKVNETINKKNKI